MKSTPWPWIVMLAVTLWGAPGWAEDGHDHDHDHGDHHEHTEHEGHDHDAHEGHDHDAHHGHADHDLDVDEYALGEVQQVELEAIEFIGVRQMTSFNTMDEVVEPMVQQVMAIYGVQPEAVVSPLTFMYDDVPADMDTQFPLTIGFTAGSGLDAEALPEGLEVFTYPTASAASAPYTGPIGLELEAAWGEFVYERLPEVGLTPGSHGREVYHVWVGEQSPDNAIELIVTVEPIDATE